MVLHVAFSLQCLLGVCIFCFCYKLLNLSRLLHSAYRMSLQIIFGCLESLGMSFIKKKEGIVAAELPRNTTADLMSTWSNQHNTVPASMPPV